MSLDYVKVTPGFGKYVAKEYRILSNTVLSENRFPLPRSGPSKGSDEHPMPGVP
jgi:hypothetical protein